MSRRAVTFATAAALVFLLALGAAVLPVPYVALLPGPTKNVLGETDGEPLISVDGHHTYPASGKLDLVTVAYRGGPGYRLDIVTALRGWIDPHVAVVPEQVLFPGHQTAEEVRKSTSRKMRQSQQAAAVAAMHELDIPVDTTVKVARLVKGFPARGVLHKGDVLVAADGERINGPSEVADTVSSHQPGESVTFRIRRDGRVRTVTVDTQASPQQPDKAMIGVYMRAAYHYPVHVNIRIGEIGGPSAGMVFALGIIDKLTEGDLTGGRAVAGTGTISTTGEVGPIGGIAQKLTGAREDGATTFLTPAKNCADAKRAKPPGLRLVKVRTLHGARMALHALKSGEGDVPQC